MITGLDVVAIILGSAAGACGVLFLDTLAMWYWGRKGSWADMRWCTFCKDWQHPIRITTWDTKTMPHNAFTRQRGFCSHCHTLLYERPIHDMKFKTLEEMKSGSL